MPYETIAGNFERASRLGHSYAVLKLLADKTPFFVPMDAIGDTEWLRNKIVGRSQIALETKAPDEPEELISAIAIDGSHIAQPVRDGIPSVVYGFAQAAAAYVDLGVMQQQRAERFPDPYAIAHAVNAALISVDFPVAGAYARQGISIQESWRELVNRLFKEKKVEVNRLNLTLLELLLLLYGEPGSSASSVPVNCPTDGCKASAVAVPAEGIECPSCSSHLFPTDTLRLHEAVAADGTNEAALGRLRSVIELLVLVGLTSLLWQQSRSDLLRSTLFIMDGPLALYGEPAKLRAQAERFFQKMGETTPGSGPFICGIEKTGALVDFGHQLARHDVVRPGELLVCDAEVLARVTNTNDSVQYGKETYWGRKFVYRCTDGRVLVITVLPQSGPAYDSRGGQPGPSGYPTLPAIIEVVERTGSSMYRDGVIPVAAAHGKAAFPIGIGTDVLKLAAEHRLGFK